MLTVKGGTGYIIEYHGAGVDTLSATGMATIGNMGAEVGATSSVFPYTQSMGEYLRLTGRTEIAEAAERDGRWYLQKDEEAEYDRHIEIVRLPLVLLFGSIPANSKNAGSRRSGATPKRTFYS